VKQTATVHIMARLWNATLVEDYSEVDRALIRSRARIALDPNIPLVQYSIRDDVAYVSILQRMSFLSLLTRTQSAMQTF
jgi:hypothetical protein